MLLVRTTSSYGHRRSDPCLAGPGIDAPGDDLTVVRSGPVHAGGRPLPMSLGKGLLLADAFVAHRRPRPSGRADRI